MVWRTALSFLAIVLFLSLCPVVLAQSQSQSDSSGSIDVKLQRLDERPSYAIVLAAIVMVFMFIIAVLVILIKNRSATGGPAPQTKTERSEGRTIMMKGCYEPSFRKEDYYDKVFKRRQPETDITDEKSDTTSFICGGGDEDRSDNIDRYLKEDERVIINVLRMKHNSCSQATLRVVTDFSKARLSRLLTELEARGVVYKQQKGRKNIITLKA